MLGETLIYRACIDAQTVFRPNDVLDGAAGVQSGANTICSETEKIFVALP